ncbi:MAG: hypothetical protein E6Q98_15855 [Rhodospirillaceae bacterium]|nr:MAG: hypothetical protein E6Q98_15855 [Rhodospirillaceae bacterium]
MSLSAFQTIEAIKAAGTRGDTREFSRLYIESSIGLDAARRAFCLGQQLGAWLARREAGTQTASVQQ